VTEEAGKQPRREFFKSLGRNVILGLTGAGVAVMIRKGTIEICIQEHAPCTQCSLLKGGCTLPKAVSYRKQGSNEKS
jgi:hypothetical protein